MMCFRLLHAVFRSFFFCRFFAFFLPFFSDCGGEDRGADGPRRLLRSVRFQRISLQALPQAPGRGWAAASGAACRGGGRRGTAADGLRGNDGGEQSRAVRRIWLLVFLVLIYKIHQP